MHPTRRVVRQDTNGLASVVYPLTRIFIDEELHRAQRIEVDPSQGGALETGLEREGDPFFLINRDKDALMTRKRIQLRHSVVVRQVERYKLDAIVFTQTQIGAEVNQPWLVVEHHGDWRRCGCLFC